MIEILGVILLVLIGFFFGSKDAKEKICAKDEENKKHAEIEKYLQRIKELEEEKKH